MKVPSAKPGSEPTRPQDPPARAPHGAAAKSEAEMILDDEDAVTRDFEARQRAKPFVSRDRFTVDKDAPNRERAVRWDFLDDEEEDSAEPEPAIEIDLDALLRPAGARVLAGTDGGGPRPALGSARPGDPDLFEPEEAMRRLGSPVAFAQHALLLAEAFFQSTGARRDEAVVYLADLFVSLPDPRFGRSALRELGPSTGIVDLYPLEVVTNLLERYPGFLRKFAFGPVLAADEPTGVLQLEPFRALELTILPDLVVRDFAIVGGARPGYRFEPAREEGLYRLVLGAVGELELLICGRSPSGDSHVERVRVEVHGDGPPLRAPDRAPRDPDAIAGWPRPTPPATVVEPSSSETEEEGAALTSAERLVRTERDALRGPKGEEEVFGFRGALRDGAGVRSTEANRAAEAAARARAGVDSQLDADPWAHLVETAGGPGREGPTFADADEEPGGPALASPADEPRAPASRRSRPEGSSSIGHRPGAVPPRERLEPGFEPSVRPPPTPAGDRSSPPAPAPAPRPRRAPIVGLVDSGPTVPPRAPVSPQALAVVPLAPLDGEPPPAPSPAPAASDHDEKDSGEP